MVNQDTNLDGGPLLCLSPYCYGNSSDKPQLLDNNSRFEDWLPGTNKMLVLTWEAGNALTEFDVDSLEHPLNRNIITQLQLWDVDAHEVSVLVPQGIYGRFSPDGQYLAFHTYISASNSNEYDTQLHLLRLADKQIIFSLASTERIIDSEDAIFDYWNVPDFFWSPTSDRLIYQSMGEPGYHFRSGQVMVNI
jgi:hypothetical protein